MAFFLSKTLLTPKKRVKIKRAKVYAKFNRLYLAIILTSLSTIGFFNFLIDPYGISRTPTFVGWNRLKPTQDNQTRLFKSAEIIQLKPKRLILGSSTVILGINPKHSSLNHDTTFYNLGLTGAYLSDIRRYFEHALLNQPNIDQVILGLDFFMFNTTKQDQNFDRQSFVGKNQISLQKKLELNLSLDTLNKSIDTVQKNRSDPKTMPYYDLGMRNEVNLEQLAQTTNTSLIFRKQIQNYLFTYYKNYQISQQALQDLKAIVEICHQNQISLTVFIAPLHASQLEAIQQQRLWPLFEQWKQEISQITPAWDFSDYNSITTEPITNNMKNFYDSVHYSQAVGDLILSRISSNQKTNFPANFGTKLLPGEQHDEYFQSIRTRRDQWRAKNPQTVKIIQEIRQ